MAEAKCIRCGASATGDSFEDASNKINHAVGLSRGIPCGISYNRVVEISSGKKPQPKVKAVEKKPKAKPSVE